MEKHDVRSGIQYEQERKQNVHDSSAFPQWLLNMGFITALVLACACLALSGWYLHQYLTATDTAVGKLFSKATDQNSEIINDAFYAYITLSRFALLACGIMVGLSFGLLGFGLFLLGIKGDIEAEGEYEKASFKFARMAPGVFVILCATVLVAICVMHPISVSESKSQSPVHADIRTSPPPSPPPDPNP